MERICKDLPIAAQADIEGKETAVGCVESACQWQGEKAPELEMAWRQPMTDLHYGRHPLVCEARRRSSRNERRLLP